MKLKVLIFAAISMLLLSNCEQKPKEDSIKANYLDFSKRDDQLTGGIKMIPIKTPKGTFKVWTKTVGNNPKIKVLL
ncbi:MAG: proline iminopeptidase, partial [Methylotenera sp.]|nr:proline iminopeptidase [Flavobacterium sp.]